MTWCNDCSDESVAIVRKPPPAPTTDIDVTSENQKHNGHIKACPSCGHQIKWKEKCRLEFIICAPGLPAGVKFDPNDQELLEHLAAKVRLDDHKLHPLIDEFIPTLEGENGICYAHPEKLPGVSKDGFVRHFFHRPSKAYTTGTRKRRKVHADMDGNETRWHKTGKTRPVCVQGKVIKGYKKILVLYTNYGKQRKPEKTNWVMHQYHLGNNNDEKEGELVVSKIFYQTQPRQCTASNIIKDSHHTTKLPNNGALTIAKGGSSMNNNSTMFIDYYNQSLISFNQTT